MSDDKAGHRDRLRQKSIDKGLESLTDQELFELLLFSMLPRIDTKPIVKSCFKKFHSFAGIVNASEAELTAIDGLGPKTVQQIKAIKCLFGRLSLSVSSKRTSSQAGMIWNFTASKSFKTILLKLF